MITQKELKNLFEYKDGLLFWKKRQNVRKSWNTRYSGKEAFTYINKEGYRTGAIYNKLFLAHRIIFLMHHGYLPEEIDHIDGNKSNNRLSNLRAADKSKNQANVGKRYSNSSSRYKGVYIRKRDGKFIASCNRKFLGSFFNEDDAARCYDNFLIKEFGQFAKTNFEATS